jgi:hypothetical protein
MPLDILTHRAAAESQRTNRDLRNWFDARAAAAVGIECNIAHLQPHSFARPKACTRQQPQDGLHGVRL